MGIGALPMAGAPPADGAEVGEQALIHWLAGDAGSLGDIGPVSGGDASAAPSANRDGLDIKDGGEFGGALP